MKSNIILFIFFLSFISTSFASDNEKNKIYGSDNESWCCKKDKTKIYLNSEEQNEELNPNERIEVFGVDRHTDESGKTTLITKTNGYWKKFEPDATVQFHADWRSPVVLKQKNDEFYRASPPDLDAVLLRNRWDPVVVLKIWERKHAPHADKDLMDELKEIQKILKEECKFGSHHGLNYEKKEVMKLYEDLFFKNKYNAIYSKKPGLYNALLEVLPMQTKDFMELMEKNESAAYHAVYKRALKRAVILDSAIDCKFFLKQDDTNEQDAFDTLSYVVERGKTSLVKILLQYFKDEKYDFADVQGPNPLYHVAKEGNHEICRFLLEDRSLRHLIENIDANKTTPLQEATISNHVEVVKCLVEGDADVVSEEDAVSSILYAIRMHNTDVCDILLNNGVEVEEKMLSAALHHYYNNQRDNIDLGCLKVLIKHNKNVNANSYSMREPTGFPYTWYDGTLLHAAVYFPTGEICEEVLKTGVDINALTGKNFVGPPYTALSLAIKKNNFECAEMIFKKGVEQPELDIDKDSHKRFAEIYFQKHYGNGSFEVWEDDKENWDPEKWDPKKWNPKKWSLKRDLREKQKLKETVIQNQNQFKAINDDEKLMCPICFYDYNLEANKRKVLECHHSFCATCIPKIEERKCPTCRKQISNDPEDYEDLDQSMKKDINGMEDAITELEAKLKTYEN